MPFVVFLYRRFCLVVSASVTNVFETQFVRFFASIFLISKCVPMQFGTLSDYGVRDYILVTEFSSALFFYLIIYPLSMVGHIHVNICLGLKKEID